MTLKDRVENLEALHTVQKHGLANKQLWLVFVSFIMFLLVIGMIAQRTQKIRATSTRKRAHRA